jgi:hypothetical protein
MLDRLMVDLAQLADQVMRPTPARQVIGRECLAMQGNPREKPAFGLGMSFPELG